MKRLSELPQSETVNADDWTIVTTADDPDALRRARVSDLPGSGSGGGGLASWQLIEGEYQAQNGDRLVLTETSQITFPNEPSWSNEITLLCLSDRFVNLGDGRYQDSKSIHLRSGAYRLTYLDTFQWQVTSGNAEGVLPAVKPTELANLLYWHDTPNGAWDNNARIQSLPDSSSSGSGIVWEQPESGDAPAFHLDGINGKPALFFDNGREDWLKGTGIGNHISDAYTFLAVFYPTKDTGIPATFSLNAGDGSNIHLCFLTFNEHFSFYWNGVQKSFAAFPPSLYQFYVVSIRNGVMQVFAEGRELARWQNSPVTLATDVQYSLAQEFDGTTKSNFFEGYLSMPTVYQRNLSDAEVQSLVNYYWVSYR